MDAHWVEQFEDFGDDSLHRTSRAPLEWLRSQSESPTEARTQLRLLVSRGVPKTPGVYGMIDEIGRLVYVGKSKLLRNRLLSYFLPNNEDEKAGRIIEHAKAIVWERQPSEFAALLREQTLIRRWQPRFNVVGMPKRHQPAFLCLGRPPAMQIYVSRQPDPTASVCQGPFYGAGNLLRAVEILNRYFKLRDCSQKTPMQFSDQLSLFELEHRAGCLRQELGTCLAPCMPGCSRAKYEQCEENATRFLMGETEGVVESFESIMNLASNGLHFERAARVRDDLQILKWLSGRLQSHRKARESLPTLYHEPGAVNQPMWYLIRNGGVEHAIEAAANAKEWISRRKSIVQWIHREKRIEATYLKSEDSLGLVTSWFQKNRKLKGLQVAIPNVENLPNTFQEVKELWLRRFESTQREIAEQEQEKFDRKKAKEASAKAGNV